jgi:hypothetical protein
MLATRIGGFALRRKQPEKTSSIVGRSHDAVGGPRLVIPLCISIAACLLSGFASPVEGAKVRLLRKKHDPYGAPRPAIGQEHVPQLTTFHAQLASLYVLVQNSPDGDVRAKATETAVRLLGPTKTIPARRTR